MIDSAPSGDEAVRLWDATTTPARRPGFAELERSLRSFPDTPLSSKPARSETLVR